MSMFDVWLSWIVNKKKEQTTTIKGTNNTPLLLLSKISNTDAKKTSKVLK